MELIVRMEGAITENNFPEYKEHMLAVLGKVNTELLTEADFIKAKEDIKGLTKAENAINKAVDGIANKTTSIRELFDAMGEVILTIKSVKKNLNKQVSDHRLEEKADIVAAGLKELGNRLIAENAHPAALSGFAISKEDFVEAVKNKKLTDSMRKSVSDLVDRTMELFAVYRSRIDINEAILSPYVEQYPSVFVDLTRLLQMETSSLEEIITARVATYLAEAEKAKLEMQAQTEAEKAKTKAMGTSQADPDEVFNEQLIHTGPEVEAGHDRASNRPIGGGRGGTGSDSTITQPVTQNEDKTRYVITVLLSCSRDDAVEITKAVHLALKPIGKKKVISVNIDEEFELI